MSDVREKLLDRMIAIYGYEHEIVLAFARCCEEWENNKWNDTALDILVRAHEGENK